MRTIRDSIAILVAIPVALAGCAGPGGSTRPGDEIRIEPLVAGSMPMPSTTRPSDVPNLGPIAYVCGPLIIFCAPVLLAAQAALVANAKSRAKAIPEAPPRENQAIREAMAGLGYREDVQAMFLDELRAEASTKWRVSPNAATSLGVMLSHVGVRSGTDGRTLLDMTATATLTRGSEKTGISATVELVRPFGQPSWREDPDVFAQELREACRELARETVRKFSS